MNRMRRAGTAGFFLICTSVLWIVSGGRSDDSASELQPNESVADLSTGAPAPEMNVLTYHNNNSRTGQYPSETSLTPANVNSGNFGKVGFLPVRGLVDAEPLYVSGVRLQGVPRNVVFVATEHDLVYAFDANSFAPIGERRCWGPAKQPVMIEDASR